MDPLPIAPRTPSDAGDCALASRLGAFYDGELDAPAAARVQDHLRDCPACRAEVDGIRELSQLAGMIGNEGMSVAALRRVHHSIEREQPYSILRIASILSGLAASVLVVGTVWLADMPDAPPPRVRVVERDNSPAWEGYAVNLDRYENLIESHDQTLLADADSRLADWILHDLNRRGK